MRQMRFAIVDSDDAVGLQALCAFNNGAFYERAGIQYIVPATAQCRMVNKDINTPFFGDHKPIPFDGVELLDRSVNGNNFIRHFPGGIYGRHVKLFFFGFYALPHTD